MALTLYTQVLILEYGTYLVLECGIDSVLQNQISPNPPHILVGTVESTPSILFG